MKVLFVTYLEFPLEIGGFQNQVRNIFTQLNILGVDAEWYCIQDCDIRNYDIIQLFSSVPSLCPIIKKANDCSIPVVITPMLGSRKRSDRYYQAVMTLSRIPHLFSEYRSLKQMLAGATHITPLTVFEKKRICKIASIDESVVTPIPNGVSEAFFDDRIDDIALPFKQYLLVVGRIENNKNQKMLIEIANKKGLNLVIVGEPAIGELDYYEECKKLAGNNVCFWGKEANIYRLKSLYKNASSTIIPSYSEMAPLVVFESLKMGTPVVCTDRCSLVGDTIPGLFFSQINKDDLTKAIQEAGRFDRSLIGNNGIFSWNEVAQHYVDVYKFILSNRQ